MFPRRVQPIWTLEFDGAPAIARLGFLEGASRATISVVVPLDAFEALGSAGRVSVIYAVGAFLGMAVTLSAASLERVVLRRWITTLGLSCTIVASLIFAVADGTTFALGVGSAAAGASLFSATLSLYVMENVAKQDLTRSESTRLLWAGAAWFVGPLSGVLLRQYVAASAPYAVSITMAILAVGYFWVLRLGSHPVLTTPMVHPTSPIRSVPRYFRRRYMRVAYAITLVRAVVWVSVFLYGSVYIVDAGLPVWASGVFLSAVATLLFMAPVVRVIADSRSTRAVVRGAFFLIAAGMGFVAALPSPVPVGLLGWAVAAVGASSLDVVGNIPFMRTVKRRDRIAMTGVFSTWRDSSVVAAPALAAMVLTLGPLRAFFGLLAAIAALTAWIAGQLPRRI